jgi:hypothetical protein
MNGRRLVPIVASALLVTACGGTAPSTAPSSAPEQSAATVTTPPSPSPTPAPSGNPAAFIQGAAYAPTIDPADFVDVIDNPYMPLTPGTTTVFQGGTERVEVTVTHDTRVILGVTAVVVHDQAFDGDELIEDTFDWFAQDRAGNVWYLGEDTKELENGKVVSTAGSWEAGVDGAQPGIVMPAVPVIGETYRQEFYEGEAEDMATVIETGGSVTVPAGTYEDTLVTEDVTPLEPDLLEHKTYARGVGVVKEEVIGGDELVELIEISTES